jgi:hypothetical protein
MKPPSTVKILSLLNFLSGLYLILAGVGLSIGSGYALIQSGTETVNEKGLWGGIMLYGTLATVTLFLGVITALLSFFLLGLKTWAWYLAFLINLFNLGISIYVGTQLGFSTITFLHVGIYALLAIYFLSAKKHFGKKAVA